MRKLIIALVACGFLTGGFYMYANREPGLGNDVLRLHIIANSDSAQDQNLKLQVRDAVLKKMNAYFMNVGTREAAEAVARAELGHIKQAAEQTIMSQGYDYPVEVFLGEYDFPTRVYGDLALPQGRYKALKIVIGEGTGKNWWCVLFPPLCVVADSESGLSLNAPEQPAKVSWKLSELWPWRHDSP
ncbi:MAG: stage II sporulation protein R [Syntrophomonadaceae bacterium]|jgi:stage II sporulation protein R|nr:stage II sporulation protein R [Syntrophomonadaceae bacterium]